MARHPLMVRHFWERAQAMMKSGTLDAKNNELIRRQLRHRRPGAGRLRLRDVLRPGE
jgi:hypothetical protein